MNHITKTNAYDFNSKILLIGDSSVGKTSITMRFVNNNFSPSFITTIGIDFVSKIINSSEHKVKLQIWDTAGQERFRTITTSYFKGANIIVIIYDVCAESTFDNIKYWMDTIKNSSCDYTGIMLVGNKIDIESSRQVSYNDGFNLAQKYNIPFFECSAKKGTNIDSIFEEAAKIHIANFNKSLSGKKQKQLVSLSVKPDEKKCCFLN
jgi:Ras-related protein Rab-8A